MFLMDKLVSDSCLFLIACSALVVRNTKPVDLVCHVT